MSPNCQKIHSLIDAIPELYKNVNNTDLVYRKGRQQPGKIITVLHSNCCNAISKILINENNTDIVYRRDRQQPW